MSLVAISDWEQEMAMKLGVITSIWAYADNLSVLESLKRVEAAGLHHVDVLGLMHGDPAVLTPPEREAIRTQIGELNLTLGSVVLLPPGNLASDDPEEVDVCMAYVRSGIDLSAELGGRQVLFNGGQRILNFEHERAWGNAVRFLSTAADYAQDAGIDITLEAEPYVYFLVHDFETTLAMVKQVDHPHLLAALDLGHMYLSRDGAHRIPEMIPWLGRVHLSENDGLLHDNAVLGTGVVPFKEYLSRLQRDEMAHTVRSRGYELCAVMELGVRGGRITDPDAWVQRSRDHVTGMAKDLQV